MESAKQKIFPPFALDLANECLWHGPHPVKVRPKAFAVLKYLVDHPSQLVTKEELLGVIWPDTFVTDAVLKVTIRELREALNDDPKAPRFIETAHRRGYRFIALVSDSDTASTKPAYFLTGHEPYSSQRGAKFTSTVVGREEAISQMHSLLQKMLGSQRQIVFVTGEAGIGKTALVDVFVETLRSNKDIRLARGQCLEQYGTGEAYLPVLEAVGRLCREEKAIADLLRTHAPMWLLQMPFLMNPLEREALSREVAGATRERMLREMVDTLDVLTSEEPLVLILEDLHWSDYSTLDLISYLARQRESAKLMLIGTYRQVDLILSRHPLRAVKQDLIAKQQCEELPLEYLTEEAISDYLRVRFADHRFNEGLTPFIHERTEGNPFFMVNAVDFLVSEKLITQRDGHWELATDIGSIKLGVPGNIKEMIEKQLDLLDPEKRRLLQAASVAGVEFSTPALVAGLEEDRDVVEERCGELARQHQYLRDRGLQELPNGEVVTRYGFAHVLYQNVLYESVPLSRRVQLHRRIGERGEEIYGERVKEIAAELAMHFERGRDYKRATEYLRQAADNAIRRFAYREAVGLARRGIDLLTPLPDSPERIRQELSLHLTLGVPLIATEGYASDVVGKVYSRARELYGQIGDTPDISEVLWGLWTFHMLRAEVGTAREIAQEFLTLSERLPYPGLALRGHWALEITFMHLGEFDTAFDHFAKALALYEPEQHREDSFLYALNPGVAMPCFAGWILWFQGKPDEALNRINDALSLAGELAEPHGLAHAHFFSSVLYQLRRELGLAQHHANQVIVLSREHGLVMYEAMARVILGWAVSNQDHARAVEQISMGLAALEATSTVLVRPHFLALFAETMAKGEQTAQALRVVDEGLSLIQHNSESYYKAELYRLKGELLFKEATGQDLAQCVSAGAISIDSIASKMKRCELIFNQSIEIAEKQRAESWRLRSTLSLARLYRYCGRAKKATELLTSIYDRFTEGFDTFDLLDVKEELDQIA